MVRLIYQDILIISKYFAGGINDMKKRILLLLFIPLVSFGQSDYYASDNYSNSRILLEDKSYEMSSSKKSVPGGSNLSFIKNKDDIFILITHNDNDANYSSLINGTLYLGLENGEVISFEKPFYTDYVNNRNFRASYILTKKEIDIFKRHDIIALDYSVYHKNSSWIFDSTQMEKINVTFFKYWEIDSFNYSSIYILSEFLK